jgi:chromate transporter
VTKNLKSKTHTSVTFAEAFRFWIKLGFINFGGPTGQIAIMHKELVEERCWIDDERFLHALNYCMLLPGPEAQQLAIYTGWLLHGTKGGIVAGAFFVIPSIFILWLLSYIYVVYGKIASINSTFYGLKAAVMAIVAAAVLRIARKALRNTLLWLLAAAAFVSIFFFHVPFPFVILGAALAGWIGSFLTAPENALKIPDKVDRGPGWIRNLKVILICLILWSIPLFLAHERNQTLFQEGLFFSKAAMITFGGAYAVLPYVSQQAVEHYGWLTAPQMMDGLGLAETTPGPLIMVLQFVGFLGAWNHPAGLSPFLAGTLGALITTWVTFVPCFLWIFLGAPYIEMLRSHQRLKTILSSITAAVVGVILNLAVWFAFHTLIPGGKHVDFFLLSLTLLFFVGIVWKKWNTVPVIGAAALIGFLSQWLR